MSLSDLSSSSFTRIFKCLDIDYPTIAQFSRTNCQIQEIAKAEEFLKVKAVAISVEYITGMFCLNMAIYWKPKSCKELQFYRRGFYNTHVGPPSFEIELNVNESEDNIIEQCFALMEQVQSKVKSCAELWFECLDIDSEVVQLISEIGLPMESLHFYACPFYINEMELFKLLKTVKPKALMMGGCLNNLNVNNLHLNLVPDCFGMGYCSDFPNCPYLPDINDQILINWLYKPPQYLNLKGLHTGITLKGALNFIENYAARIHSKKYDCTLIDLGNVKLEEGFERDLIMAQRSSVHGIKWHIWSRLDGEEGTYHMATLNSGIEIKLGVVKDRSKITKEQARRQIQQLAADVRRYRERNNAFNFPLDNPIYKRICQLRKEIYVDWDELHDMIVQLPYGLYEIDE